LIIGTVDQDLRKCCHAKLLAFFGLFGPPAAGKSHLAAAIGLARVENGWRVLFMRTSDLVQRLRSFALESALAKLDKYHLLILDDIVHVPQQRQGVMGGDAAKKAQVTGAIPRCDTATKWTWA
jgi:DNA replication protein DnaC